MCLLCNEDDEWDITDDDLCDHSWFAGFMVVDEEDLEKVARMRQANGSSPVECCKCGKKYTIN